MTEGIERDDWAWEELLDEFRTAIEDELHTAVSGRVESYDATTQKAVVQPMVQRNLTREDGTQTTEILPPIRNVPVLVPRGGGYFGPHFPLSQGDFVLNVISERDLSRFLQTGQLSVAPDSRLHHLAHAVALPGLFPNASALSGLTSGMDLGRVGGPILTVTATDIQVGGAVTLAEAPNLGTHLAAIASALDAVANRISVPHGGSNVDLIYGVAAKAGLDASTPIPTTITKGT